MYVQKFKLGNPRGFHYLNQTNCFELEGVDESKQYRDTRRAMNVVGISSKEQDTTLSGCCNFASWQHLICKRERNGLK